MTSPTQAAIEALNTIQQECQVKTEHKDSWVREFCGELAAETLALLASGGEGRWQDISTAPKDGTCILLYADISRGAEMKVVGWFCEDNEKWLFGNWQTLQTQPTHWMKLPDAPGVKVPAPNDGERKRAAEALRRIDLNKNTPGYGVECKRLYEDHAETIRRLLGGSER